jgi:hypothetical protein
MKNLSQALVKFQSQLKPVSKDSENPFFKSRYADLSNILQAVLPILTANGLAVIQPMKVTEAGFTVLITRLIHESGEFIESEMILPNHADPQKYGALISYYKRYQIQALLGINTETDDDANSISQGNNYRPGQSGTYSKPVNTPAMTSQIMASEAQKNALRKMNIEFAPNISKDEASKLIAQRMNK